MHQLKRWSNQAMVLAFVALLVSVSALAPARARASGPEDTVNRFIAEINKDDGAAAAAVFTPDGVFTSIDDGSFAVIGTDALTFAFTSDDSQTQVELTDVTVHGGTVKAVAHVSDDISKAAGVNRYLQPLTAVVRDNKIAEFHLTLDLTDAQTRTYLAYEQSQSGGDDGTLPGTVQLPMTAAGGASGGTAFIYEIEGHAGVAIQNAPGSGAPQPAAILVGDCHSPGAIASPLASVVDGSSFTLISLSKSELLAGDYAIGVENTGLGAGRFASCGEVESATVMAEPAAPPPPPTTPPPPTGVIKAPSTGTGPDSSGANATSLLAALMLAGAALASTGMVLRTARRS